MRVYVESYGCQMNVADADLMRGVLAAAGHEAVAGPAQADVILVNTCAVRERAEDRVSGRLTQLLRYKHDNPDVLLGVTGCMAEHLKATILERMPFVDLVVGPDAYRRLPELVAQAGCGEPLIDVRLDRGEVYEGLARGAAPEAWAATSDDPEAAGQTAVSAFVTVQRGCDKFCTFCVVPFTRGRERAVPPRDVLRQVRELAEAGVREVTLLGQTVNSYRHEDVTFAALLRAVAAVPGIARVRFTSPYPADFDDDLIGALAEVPEVMPHVHLPVQSGSDAVLRRMARGHTVDAYRRLVDTLRARVPGIALSTDVIVGFSGETDDDYAATVRLLEEVRYDFAYLFKYSERDLARASRDLPDDVPAAVKGERLAGVIALQEAVSGQVFGGRVGGLVEVLVTGPSRKDPGDLVGRSADFKKTILRGGTGAGRRPGELVRGLVTGATAHTLLAAPA